MSYIRQKDEDEDYNPFADSAVIAADQVDNEDDPTMYINKKSTTTTTTTTSASIGRGDDSKDRDLRKREEELAKKERELERMRLEQEQQMKSQQQQQQQQSQQSQQQDGEQQRSRQSYASQVTPNWPPCKPIIYLSIKDEIDPTNQVIMNQIYYSWLLTCACLVVNFGGTMAKLIVGAGGKDFGLSILYLFVIPFLSFILWFKPIYSAYMKDSSFYFVIFFCFNAFHLLFLLYMVIGGQSTGGAGFINTITLFSNKQIGAGVVCSLSLILWIICFSLSCFLFFRVLRHYKEKGHTLQEARQQAFTSAAQSEVGQKAVSSAITGIANSYVRQRDQQV